MSGHLLIVDDDPAQRAAFEVLAEGVGYRTSTAASGAEALDRLAAPNDVDVVLLDLVMPDLDGFAVLERLSRTGCTTPVVVVTAGTGADAAFSALRLGALDYVSRPVSPERLAVSLQTARRLADLSAELRRLARRDAAPLTLDDMPSRSAAMATALRLGRRAASSTIPVLIEGESGTGKSLFARAIAASGPRAGRPFIAVHCGGRADPITEAITAARGGTLFLDAIDLLPASGQEDLLGLLQAESRTTGKRKASEVRVIAASSTALIEAVKAGTFREDLYYRLGVSPIGLPPLRNRREDIPVLAHTFLTRFAAEQECTARFITTEALAALEAAPWPGNVDELRRSVLRAVAIAPGTELTMSDFPQLSQPAAATTISRLRDVEIVSAPQSSAPLARLRLTQPDGHVRPLDALEREIIAHAVTCYEGQMTEVARRLRIGRSTLYRKLKEFDLDPGTCDLRDTTSPEAAA